MPSPVDCPLDYTFTVDPPLSNVITLNSASNSFLFNNEADPNLAGTYVITLTGTVNGISETATFTLVVLNPCLSETFVTITAGQIP